MPSFGQLLRSRAAGIAGMSYAAFAANSVAGLLSIPLAVAHLGKDQIALWTLVTQFVSYLVWLDLGVGTAVGRKIADPIAKGNSREINACWSLSISVLALLGVVLVAIALMGAGRYTVGNAIAALRSNRREPSTVAIAA